MRRANGECCGATKTVRRARAMWEVLCVEKRLATCAAAKPNVPPTELWNWARPGLAIRFAASAGFVSGSGCAAATLRGQGGAAGKECCTFAARVVCANSTARLSRAIRKSGERLRARMEEPQTI